MVAPRQANAAWLTNADEAQALIAALIDHAETLTGTGVEQGCVECYYGYAWVERLQGFVPCGWCHDTTRQQRLCGREGVVTHMVAGSPLKVNRYNAPITPQGEKT